ncbi:hypothetical protein WAE61_17545, partial [Comamonadaceae bacterium PP-2]
MNTVESRPGDPVVVGIEIPIEISQAGRAPIAPRGVVIAPLSVIRHLSSPSSIWIDMSCMALQPW